MLQQTGNLSTPERAFSAAFGIALALFSLRRGGALTRTLVSGASAALLARAWAGHCGVKSALAGHTTVAGGLADQWDRMTGGRRRTGDGLSGSLAHASTSDAVDRSVDESFPASDPPASHLPDEPPSNADAKWAAARAAGIVK
jgi:hypothetical protein